MSIAVAITVDVDILDAYSDLATTAPRLVRQTFANTVNHTANKALAFMQEEPGLPKYPIRWKSQKQRRYVMAKLRAEGNLPHQRRHEYVRRWEVRVVAKDTEGSVTLEHPGPEAVFIGGIWQQPFHQDTGWNTDTEAYVRFSDELQNDLIRQWYILNTVIIPKGGVR